VSLTTPPTAKINNAWRYTCTSLRAILHFVDFALFFQPETILRQVHSFLLSHTVSIRINVIYPAYLHCLFQEESDTPNRRHAYPLPCSFNSSEVKTFASYQVHILMDHLYIYV
jgi:hypothetical protein